MTITDIGVTADDIYRAQAHPLVAAEAQRDWLERVVDAAFDGRSATSPEQAKAALLNHELHLAELYAAEFGLSRETARVEHGYEAFAVVRGGYELPVEFRELAAAQRLADLLNGVA
ncbi:MULTISPECIES: hypothetical protein [unclassified Saccharopolyspora]|uniref:hypothetical protein n=1 Tax=unclassified Saccharopolyspora TaxID=2646250 RepID=UPI001CD7FC57|nr:MULTISPECIES: hypothetical protein [unclassified Saccharopolyspora]MCA1185780.1 hypothetical protein [Saccharopolyspora sp. 6T]MCA1191692.1 hypothetical protein [Saccharopolyspora sp. 6V]